jgi:predicted  nucleic acid-binding Zn-ribbon protein
MMNNCKNCGSVFFVSKYKGFCTESCKKEFAGNGEVEEFEWGMKKESDAKSENENDINDGIPTLNLEKKRKNVVENITKKTKVKNLESMIPKRSAYEKLNTDQLTSPRLIKHKESGMNVIKLESEKKTKNEKKGVIQPTVCTHSSIDLEEEKSNSIKSLTNSTNQLIKLAENVINEDDRPANFNIELAVKCFSEARNQMKTKLEFMKFNNLKNKR